MDEKTGMVYLVGAGPGDPGLLTMRGAAVLARADVVVYDRLAPSELLSLAPEGARRIYVGKAADDHAMSQEEINALLVREAQAGNIVVRLKGGDPFVFGRGGEEGLALEEAGVEFEVVPGVTAGIAGPAYAGIPATHRGVASAVALVTGHEDPGKSESDLDWAALARMPTVVFYMGVGHLDEIAGKLIEAGRSAETPAATIERATTADQRTVAATLGTLAAAVREAGIRPPAITVVGDVVGLREKLAWWERRPLAGRRIVVTRSRQQASRLSSRLTELGADVTEMPTIAIEPLPLDELGGAVDDLAEFDWVVLTSPNGVGPLFECLASRRADARRLAGVRVAAIGPGTAEALASHGIVADVVPGEAVGEALAEALLASGVGPGTRVLLPRAEEAREVVPQTLLEAGALVEEVAVYRTVLPAEVDEAALDAVIGGRVDLVTLTSSSTARNLASLVKQKRGEAALEELRAKARFASIGPITTATAREMGWTVAVEAGAHTIPGLVAAIRLWAAR